MQRLKAFCNRMTMAAALALSACSPSGTSGDGGDDSSARTETVAMETTAAPLEELQPQEDTEEPTGQHEWTIEYAWSHDVPRGGVHRMRLEHTGTLTEEWQPHESKVQRSVRTIPEKDCAEALKVALAIVDRFDFESARRTQSHDVPVLTFSLGSKAQTVQLQFDDWLGTPIEIVSEVQRLLRIVHVRVR